ncbi:Flp family type IVb pilin [Marimonas sp. MJW-29]|uniref:Flp family type IVb pilin n=1 Tax=Sulfitobacter sediminis TaxID=3234186 RepID=A0ABV3RK02_9RHOB
MRENILHFLRSEDGAVTVDWVVLTAAVVSLAATVIFAIQGSTDDVGDGVGTYLTDVTPGDV